MKPFTAYKYILLLIFSLMINPTKASEPDSLQSQESGIDLYAIGGVGMTTGSSGYGWENYFYNGPAFALGLELPFTSSHIFALQLYGHTWFSKSNFKYPINSDEEEHINMSEDYYNAMYLSTYIKYYLYSPSKKISFSLFLGVTILAKTDRAALWQYGIGLNYKLTKDIMISVMRRLNVPDIDLDVGGGGTGGSDAPNYLMLEISYKIL